MMAYAWDEAQTAAVEAPDGALDVLGTGHDIPSQGDCKKCHDQVPDRSLGFTAVLLDHEPSGGPDEVTLARLASEGRLSDAPAAAGYPVPGDDVERAALGYLHVNCGGCHHARSSVSDSLGEIPPVLRLLSTDGPTPVETSLYATTVNVPTHRGPGANTFDRIEPGCAADSTVHRRVDTRLMPPVGVEIVDATGLAAIDAWILHLNGGVDSCPE
jgi:hypothetical protein